MGSFKLYFRFHYHFRFSWQNSLVILWLMSLINSEIKGGAGRPSDYTQATFTVHKCQYRLCPPNRHHQYNLYYKPGNFIALSTQNRCWWVPLRCWALRQPWDFSRFKFCADSTPNSKHWFTTSFLQPLPVYVRAWALGCFHSYAIGPRKLSANEQFFVGAQTVVSLLQKNQINPGLSFIAVNKVYTSTNKTTIVWIETELFFFSFF